MPHPRPVSRPLLAGLLGLACLAGAAGPAAAAVTKCTGPGGKLTYTDQTCPRSTEKRQLIRTTPEGGAGQPTAGPTGSSIVAPGLAAGGDNGNGNGSGASPPQPTIVGGPNANAGTDAAANAAAAPSVGGANGDTGQTAVGAGATAPTDVAAPVPATP